MHANDIRQRLLALLTAAVLLALCGCAPSGPQDSAQPAAAPSPSPSLPQPTTPEPDSDSASEDALVFLTYTSEEDAIRDAQIFSEKTGVDVVVAEGSDQAYELMLLDFAAGKHTYDLMLIDNALGSLYTSDDLIDRGYYSPLQGSERIERCVSSMLPALQQCVTRDGVIYALPHFVKTKVIEYDDWLYEARDTGDLRAYAMRTGKTATKSDVEVLPEMQSYPSWNALLENALSSFTGELACNAMLEQYSLSADRPDFSFDSQEFIDLLALMKDAKLTKDASAAPPFDLNINSFAFYTMDPADPEGSTDLILEHRSIYAPPTVDPENRLAMAYGVIAINAFSDKKDSALRFLEQAADNHYYGYEGYEEGATGGYIAQYGTPYMAACFADASHIRTLTGDDPENQQRWLDLTARFAPITNTGFLTAFNMELFPMYCDGAITAEQCARMTQERFEMSRLEQGR